MKVVEIVTDVLSLLDAEGSERYLWKHDFEPAINYASNWAVALFNRFIAETKRPEEALSSISRKIQLNYPSTPYRIDLSAIETSANLKLWTILGIEMDYPVDGNFNTKPYKRITAEQVGRMYHNCFAPGNNLDISDSTFEGAYMSPLFFDTFTSSYTPGTAKLVQLYPKITIAGATIWVTYCAIPTRLDIVEDSAEPEYPTGGLLNTSEILLPEFCRTMIVQKVAQMVSLKEFGTSNMFQITSSEIQQLAGLMS